MRRGILQISVLIFLSAGVAAQAADSGPGVSSQYTQTVELEKGWNTVSFRVSGLSFEEDIKQQCSFAWFNSDLAGEDISKSDIPDDERYYVWSQKGNEWTHPDDLSGSAVSLNAAEDCILEVKGERTYTDSIELEKGWNLVPASSGELATIRSECSLKWYNQRLSGSERSTDNLNKYYFWTNSGGNWGNPLNGGYELKEGDGVYVNSAEDCQVDPDLDSSETPDSGSGETVPCEEGDMERVDRRIELQGIDSYVTQYGYARCEAGNYVRKWCGVSPESVVGTDESLNCRTISLMSGWSSTESPDRDSDQEDIFVSTEELVIDTEPGDDIYGYCGSAYLHKRFDPGQELKFELSSNLESNSNPLELTVNSYEGDRWVEDETREEVLYSGEGDEDIEFNVETGEYTKQVILGFEDRRDNCDQGLYRRMKLEINDISAVN